MLIKVVLQNTTNAKISCITAMMLVTTHEYNFFKFESTLICSKVHISNWVCRYYLPSLFLRSTPIMVVDSLKWWWNYKAIGSHFAKIVMYICMCCKKVGDCLSSYIVICSILAEQEMAICLIKLKCHYTTYLLYEVIVLCWTHLTCYKNIMNLISTNYNYMMTPPLPAFDLNSRTHERGIFAIF